MAKKKPEVDRSERFSWSGDDVEITKEGGGKRPDSRHEKSAAKRRGAMGRRRDNLKKK